MRIWVDDIRPAPEGYVWCKSVKQAIYLIDAFIALKNGHYKLCESQFSLSKDYGYEGSDDCLLDNRITLIDIDHDAGDYAKDGGDYIRLLDWLEENDYKYPIRIHSMNSEGIENMRRVIERNGWELIP